MVLVTASFDMEKEQACLGQTYLDALRAAGLEPVLYYGGTAAEWDHLAGQFDALVVTGGGDIEPARYGAAAHPKTGSINLVRDEFEIELCRRFYRAQKPILGICRGIQVINVAFGGTLWQDIEDECGAPHPRSAEGHGALLAPWSCLTQALGGETQIRVNSFHHQAVKDVGEGLRASAYNDQGIIEAVESGDGLVMGVQWHPERMYAQNEAAMAVFTIFSKLIHQKNGDAG